MPAIAVCLNPTTPKGCSTNSPVVVYNFPGPGWSAKLGPTGGGKWIWDAALITKSTRAENDHLIAGKNFELPDCTTDGGFAGHIYLAADDFAELFVNGNLVGKVGSTTDAAIAHAAQSSLTRFDLSSNLKAGTNVITVHGINGSGQFNKCQNCSYSANPAGVVFGGSVGCRGTQ